MRFSQKSSLSIAMNFKHVNDKEEETETSFRGKLGPGNKMKKSMYCFDKLKPISKYD